VKTIEVLNLLEAFGRIEGSPALTNEEKAGIGKEILRQLPFAHLASASHASIEAVSRSIGERVATLEKESERRITEDTRKIDSPSKETQKTRQPLRKAPANP
jgi:hypothetical protein